MKIPSRQLDINLEFRERSGLEIDCLWDMSDRGHLVPRNVTG